jgi:hypothetical protein
MLVSVHVTDSAILAVETVFSTLSMQSSKGKVIPVTGHGGPQGCETSRLHIF